MGPAAWQKLKTTYRQKAQHHCMICGRYVPHRPGDWLELHEQYAYDFKNLIQSLTGYVAICHDCHLYIHQGLLGIQLQQGRITAARAQQIIAKGDALLKQFNLQKITYPSRQLFESPNWQLAFGGKLYSSQI